MNADCSECDDEWKPDQDGDSSIDPGPPTLSLMSNKNHHGAKDEGEYVPVTRYENPYKNLSDDLTEEQM